MLIYEATKQAFIDHVRANQIDERILEQMRTKGRGGVGQSELRSWRNSMQYMMNVLNTPEIPHTAGVAIEYVVPQTSKRIDFILTGFDGDNKRTAIIVELKQWESVTATNLDAVVRTFVGGAQREIPHPSYQAWTYAMSLQDFNESVETHAIQLRPCAYLHNCSSTEIVSDFYHDYLEKAPAFLKSDADKLQRFIQQHVRYGDDGENLYLIENGRIRPSKSLADRLASMLQGNQEFLMIDDQKLVYEAALDLSRGATEHSKRVLLVEGGPGTGKSVVAINLLVQWTQHGKVVKYVTKNQAPRDIYEAKLTGTLRKSSISNLLCGSGAFCNANSLNAFDVLIADEAHRLNEKSGLYQNKGENQIAEIIRAAKLSVFFLDEDQKVTWKDIGCREQIEHWAKVEGATLSRATLSSQFRCNGSDGYLAWLDQSLQIRQTANTDLTDLNYHVEVVDSPTDLRDKIFEHNQEANKARLVAGYCWDWASKKNPNAMDIALPEHGFAMQWNLDPDGSLWLIQPNSVYQIGCIHTCQGLEMDYVGVIIGPDLIVRDGKIVTQPSKRSKMDASIKGYKKARASDPIAADAKADAIIKNTYRTLLSRGMKGCYIWCADPETNAYFKSTIQAQPTETHKKNLQSLVSSVRPAIPFPAVPAHKLRPYENAIPVVDLKVAAGNFGALQHLPHHADDFTWITPPDYIKVQPGMFVAQVVGESMNTRIPDGAWCLFRAPEGGSRQGKIVLVQHQDIQDPDTGASYTIKRYHSTKKFENDDSWQHNRIELQPMSNLKHYKPIVLTEKATAEVKVIGVFVAVMDTPAQ